MRVLAICAALAAPWAAAAHASTISLEPVTGQWLDVATKVPVSNSGPGATATILWGQPRNDAGLQSGYSFTGAAPGAVTLGQEFDLGVFTAMNRTIARGTSITGASLALDVTLDFGGQDFDLSPVFRFDQWETFNQARPCADGGANGSGVNANGCADRVLILDNAPSSSQFTIGGTTYALEVTGFLFGDGLLEQFWTREAADNSAVLRARLVALPPAPVPLPAAGGLLLAALGAVAALRRRRPAV